MGVEFLKFMFGVFVFVLVIYTLSISILFVSREELGLIDSDQLMCDLCK